MMNNINNLFFSLPPEISYTSKLLGYNKFAFIFRHNTLGEIGRLIVLPKSYGSEIIYEVPGEPDDPMTTKRHEIFNPIAKSIIKISDQLFGKDVANNNFSVSKTSTESAIIKAEIIPCDICGATIVAKVFASDAYTIDRLEDYARLAFSKIKELNVPTWIIGAELVLKVWPKRESARIILQPELHNIWAQLKKNHCIN